MRETWAAVGAIVVKDWTRFFRQPFFMVISVIIPLVFIFFYSLIVPVSATNPIMIADEDHTPASAEFIDAMRDIGGFAHVVVGSGEAAYAVLMGDSSVYDYFFRFLIPTGLGNIIGGTGIFTLLVSAQVKVERK